MQNKRIAIIGAGIAGLSAAHHLSKTNHSVTIFERKTFNGGRVFSYYDKNFEEYLDNGQHLLIGAYENFLKIVDETNQNDSLRWQKSLSVDFLHEGGELSQLKTNKIYGKFGLVIGLLKMNGLDYPSKYGIIIFLIKLILNFKFDTNFSAKELLYFSNQSEQSIKIFWEPFIIATMNSNIEVVPSDLFIYTLKKALLGRTDNSKLIFPTVDLSKLINGIVIFLQENGVEVKNNKKVKLLKIENQCIKSLMINNEIYDFDAVISTIPPNFLKILYKNSDIKNEILDEFKFSPIISAFFLIDKDIDFEFVGLIDSKVHWIFNRKRILLNCEKNIITTTISAAENFDGYNQNEILSIIWNEIIKFVPDLAEVTILEQKLMKDSHATVKFTKKNIILRLGTLTTFDNFFLAGDWTDTKLPATIESACVSGMTAAKKCMDYLTK